MVNPYERFAQHELILRDELALDRTILANERTLLAYMRTGFTLSVVGLTLVKLFEDIAYHIVGWLLIPFGAIFFVIGFSKYRALAKSLQTLRGTMKGNIKQLKNELKE